MQSIFGLLGGGPQIQDSLSERLFENLALRGGHTRKVYSSGGDVMLGLRTGAAEADPNIVTNADQTVIAVAEGEIYNGSELARMTGSFGFQAIPALYEKFGADFPRYLNGVFGIALFDTRQRRLCLARDHLGSHSLFYASTPGIAIFATTIHPILASGLISDELSRDSMKAYFSSTNIPAPDTMFREIRCVRPGATVVYESGRWSDHDYWRSGDLQEDCTRPEKEYIEEVRELILDSIAIRARLGGNYGSLVSGGVDTGIIAASLSGMEARRELPAFSITFAEKFYSDADLQQIMYRRYPLRQHSKVLTPREFADTLQRAIIYLDKPVNDTAFVGMYHAFRMAREEGCDAVFDGEAADELFFTGHGRGEMEFQRYLRIPFLLRRSLSRVLAPHCPAGSSFWRRGRRFLYKLGLTDEERTLSRMPSFYNHDTPILTGPVPAADPFAVGKRYLAQSALREPLNRYNYGITKTYLPDGLLFKNERMAAANDIINRTPFIDHRLVELAFRIPAAYKLTKPTETDDGTKQVYKKAIRGLIPDEILQRKKKRGFSQPSRVWYRGALKDFVGDTLLCRDPLYGDHLNRAYVRHLWSEHVSGMHNHDYLVNSVLIFELWLRAFRDISQLDAQAVAAC